MIGDRSVETVVVGAGPAGSATATLLAQAGHEVVLLDSAKFPRHKPCSEFVSPGTERLLTRFGAADLIAHGGGRPLKGMVVQAPNGDRFQMEYSSSGSRRVAFAIPRLRLDATLVDTARCNGVEIREHLRACAFHRSAHGVHTLTVRDRDGETGQIHARLVIGADGRHSLVARSLNLQQAVKWPNRLGLVTHYGNVPWSANEGMMSVGPNGYLGVAPIAPDVVSIGLVAPMPQASLGSPGDAFESAVRDYPTLARLLARGERMEPVRGVGPLAHRVSAVAGPGFLLVGDAAGFLDPFTGEGIHRALRGAELAAKAAHQALQRPGPVVNPSPVYERLRQRVFGAKERLTMLIQIFVHVPTLMNYVVARLRRRPDLAAELSNVLGDLAPAQRVLNPTFLTSLLGP